jgi:hypothetical protein
MQNVADDRHSETGQAALLLANCQGVGEPEWDVRERDRR